MVHLRSFLALPTLGFTVQSLLCAFQCYSRLLWASPALWSMRWLGTTSVDVPCYSTLLWATLGPLSWMCCGRARQEYFGWLCGYFEVEVLCYKTTHTGLLWAHFGGCAVAGLVWAACGLPWVSLVDVTYCGRLVWAILGPLWWMRCGRAVGYCGTTLVDVLLCGRY